MASREPRLILRVVQQLPRRTDWQSVLPRRTHRPTTYFLDLSLDSSRLRRQRRHVRGRVVQLLLMGALQRKAQAEFAALADFALCHDVAAVLAQDLAAHRQAQARAPRPFGADEGPEKVCDLGRWNSRAVIADVNLQPSLVGIAADTHGYSRLLGFLHGIERITDDVQPARGAGLRGQRDTTAHPRRP